MRGSYPRLGGCGYRLPASATLIGSVVLRQIPNLIEVLGIVLVAGGVARYKRYLKIKMPVG
jgi:threonine/homoserine efflux transporter RhtA